MAESEIDAAALAAMVRYRQRLRRHRHLTEEQSEMIRTLYASGKANVSQIARAFKASRGAIHNRIRNVEPTTAG